MKQHLFACVLALAASISFAAPPAATSGVRMLPIAGDGFAGSSVNMLAGSQNTLFTEGRMQYAAFYAADGALVLARRTIGSDIWETRRTSLRRNVADAHNAIALVVDGAGYLHVAWDHHAESLNYARSVAPHSLEIGPPEPMTGSRENTVTYPAFLRLPDGDLLFSYRDAVSGRGNHVLNRYSVRERKWTRIHAKLVDGQGKRSAYPSFHIDRNGHLHLAWVWRETNDVETNHDIAYARSRDGGVTWTTSTGKPLTVPITAATAEYAVRVPMKRSLMNPPAITTDADGRPLIASYWTPDGGDIPQYHLVRHDGSTWSSVVVTKRTSAFKLAGTNTKRPPLSRAVILSERPWPHPARAHLVFRDDEHAGRAVVATSLDVDSDTPSWTISALTDASLGAWEPSFDPEQWSRFGQLHLLVQRVEQRDSDDRAAATVQPSAVASLIWMPALAWNLSAEDQHRASTSFPAAGTLDRPLDPTEILPLLESVADCQLSQPYERDPRGWEIAPFYIGALELAKLSSSARFHDELMRRFEQLNWQPAPRDYNADDYAVVQAYLELYRQHGEARMLAPSRALFDRILANPPTTPLDWGRPGVFDRWSWCDALFMGPASFLDVYNATGDRRYLHYMNREWWVTTQTLYVPSDRLYARDESFLDVREPNGRRLYWSRGNGWVSAGLARVLDRFPKDHEDYPRYVDLYRDMMEAVLAAQQPDGLWRPGLLDPKAHPARETSGSSFYTFALTWGINRGILDRERFEPAVRRAWNALKTSVTAEGRLENVQPIGAAPDGFDPKHTDTFGVGAFLLAGSEIYKLAGGRSGN